MHVRKLCQQPEKRCVHLDKVLVESMKRREKFNTNRRQNKEFNDGLDMDSESVSGSHNLIGRQLFPSTDSEIKTPFILGLYHLQTASKVTVLIYHLHQEMDQ